MIVKALKAANGVTLGEDYLVVSISSESFRVICDSGEPIIYPIEDFEVLADQIPEDWVREDFDEDDFRIRPPGIEQYFFEEFFDDVPGHLKKLFDYVIELDAWQREVSPTVSFPYREVKRKVYKPLLPTH